MTFGSQHHDIASEQQPSTNFKLDRFLCMMERRNGDMQTNQRKKILYIMGIDWNWIYQRPQIIAEYLCRDFDVTVVYPVKIWDRNIRMTNIQETTIQHLKLWTFPLQRKSKLVGNVSDKYICHVLRICYQYDYIYIDYPTYIEYIPEDYPGLIIYDCIDDYSQMCVHQYGYQKIVSSERVLLQRSDIILATSQRLVKKLNRQTAKKIMLVRNAMHFDKLHTIKEAEVKKQYKIGYIGTIAGWFDIDLIVENARKYSLLTYSLIGPCMEFKRVECSQINYEGIVEHSKLYMFIQDYDCLIIPFIVNEIIKAVDPVKLYEYIAFGKCIISVYYEELEFFKEFVYFYTTHEEYHNLIEDLMQKGFPPKYNIRQQKKFLIENSWEERYKQILEAIAPREEIYKEAEG